MMVQVTKKLLGRIEKLSYVYGPLDSNPLEMLKHFFESNTAEEFTQYLKNWDQFTYGIMHTTSANAAQFLTTHQMACRMVNTAWLLSQVDKKPLYQLFRSEMQNTGFVGPKYFSKVFFKVRLDESLKMLKVVFKSMAPAWFHQQLYAWLHDSLSENKSSEQLPNQKELYFNLLKLLNCCRQMYELLILKEPMDDSNRIECQVPIQEIAGVDSKFKEALGDAALNLFESSNPIQLNKSLRKLLVDYVLFNADVMPPDLSEVVNDFYWLSDFVDTATEQLHQTA